MAKVIGNNQDFWAQIKRLFPQLEEMRNVRAFYLSSKVNEAVVLYVEAYAEPNLNGEVITRRYRLEEWPEEEENKAEKYEEPKFSTCGECGYQIFSSPSGAWEHDGILAHHPAVPKEELS